MAYTTEQYNAIKAAYATGALIVMYGDKQMTFRSPEQMKQIMGEMEIELGLKKKKGRNMRTSFTKGV